MNKSNIKCPRCQSEKLYKYGLDLQGNQTYQCRECNRQFTPNSVIQSRTDESKYGRCPKCNHSMYLHHRYDYYNDFTCGNKKCRHSIKKYHTIGVEPASCNNLIGSMSMKGMRHSLYIILNALTMFYICGTSTRKISLFLDVAFNIKVSHVTIYNWVQKFAPYFKFKADKLMQFLDLNSSEWHADETVVFINGEKYYLWLVIDSETRFILGFHLTKSRSAKSAAILINAASTHGSCEQFITDRLPSYNIPAKNLLVNTNHLPVAPMSSLDSNNLIESFNKTFKRFYRGQVGFKSEAKANNLIFMWIFAYNFIHPHSGIEGKTPAVLAGLPPNLNAKNWFVAS